GYWQLTDKVVNENNLLMTADSGDVKDGYLHLISHNKHGIQLANGHYVYPEPVESRLQDDTIFENVVIYGENQAKLTAICRIAKHEWQTFLNSFNISDDSPLENEQRQQRVQGILYTRINALLQSVPNAPRIDYILPTFNDWLEDGLIDTSGKVNRPAVEEFFAEELRQLYTQQYPFQVKL
ncbi:MAG: hypothetical protein R3240_10470, partial [Gammaproteobacteria bacterium]|nr:hypothetical protein [Gammaproteobacteria bacterium]